MMKEEIARLLLSIQAVFLRPDDPFTWTSGIRSPIYCDNRLILSYPDIRTIIEQAMAQSIREHFAGCEILMGTSTAGIPHAAIAAQFMGLPMGYVRGGRRDHGRENRIEGRLDQAQKTVVVEDLISTAGSALEAVQALRDAGADVLGIASIFTYGMASADARLREAGVVNHSLCDFDTLICVAAQQGYILPSDLPRLVAFRDNPDQDGWRYPGATGGNTL